MENNSNDVIENEDVSFEIKLPRIELLLLVTLV